MLMLHLVRRHRPATVAAFALALAMFFAPAGAEAGNLYMVSVGVTNAIGHPHLNATAKDARDMAKWAQAQQGKLFYKAYITTLTDNNATRQYVLNALTAIQSKAKPGDYVIFYDSSHGGDGGNGQYVMCVYDGNLLWSQVLNALQPINANKIVILDTCESGMAISSAPGYPVVFASSSSKQSSFDGSAASGNSLYTQYLLEGLYGKADSNKDGYISLVEATSYAGQMLQKADKNKGPNDQQNSTWSRPTSVDMHLPIAKLTNGYTGGNTGSVGSTGSTSSSVTAGMVYSGSENLQGYGKLSFTFQSGGKVIMHDAKSSVTGTWAQSGSQITLNFAQVGATYHAGLSGNQMFGYAVDTKGQAWSFNVHR
jgi:hypothetical protein